MALVPWFMALVSRLIPRLAGGDGNLAEYYARLASRISEETGDTAETETHQPVYNEDLVR